MRHLAILSLILLACACNTSSVAPRLEGGPSGETPLAGDRAATAEQPGAPDRTPLDQRPSRGEPGASLDLRVTPDGKTKVDGSGFPCAMVTDTLPKTMPKVPKPAYLGSFIDPVFGHKVTRVTGDPGTAVPVVGGSWGTTERHHYSKTMAWNIDQTLLFLEVSNGSHPDLFLDGKTFKVLFAQNQPGQSRWHPKQPNLRVYVTGNLIGTWDVLGNVKTTVATVAGYTKLQLGPGEGNLSLDGNRLAVLAQSPAGKQVAFAFDLVSKKKYPDIDLDGVTIDWVSISPLGDYVVVHGTYVPVPWYDTADQSQVYDLQGNKVGPFWFEYSLPNHYDLTVDDSGDQVAVGKSQWVPPALGALVKRRLVDGVVTELSPGGWVSHASTRNLKRPGWAYATYEVPLAVFPPFVQEIVAIKLDGSKAVQRLVHTHSVTNGYQSEAHGSPSPDGMKVIWASNWDDANGSISAYVVELCVGP